MRVPWSLPGGATGPAGSLFHIFAFAAIASIPNQPPLWQCMLVAVLTTAFCLLVGLSSRVLRSRRTPWEMPAPARLTAEEKRAARLEAVGYLAAAGLAGTLATLVGQWLGFGHNYWAMVAAVVPLVGRTTRHRIARGVQRIIGTVLGLLLLAGILLLHPVPWQTVLVIAICQFGAELYIARNYVVAQVFVTPLALISTLLVAPAAPGPAAARPDRGNSDRRRRRDRRGARAGSLGAVPVPVCSPRRLSGLCPLERPGAGPVSRAGPFVASGTPDVGRLAGCRRDRVGDGHQGSTARSAAAPKT